MRGDQPSDTPATETADIPATAQAVVDVFLGLNVRTLDVHDMFDRLDGYLTRDEYAQAVDLIRRGYFPEVTQFWDGRRHLSRVATQAQVA